MATPLNNGSLTSKQARTSCCRLASVAPRLGSNTSHTNVARLCQTTDDAAFTFTRMPLACVKVALMGLWKALTELAGWHPPLPPPCNQRDPYMYVCAQDPDCLYYVS